MKTGKIILSQPKIENVSGDLKFTDAANESGKFISDMGSIQRYTDPDEHTYIHWKLDEEGPPYANTGYAGTLSLTAYNGTPVTNRVGLFGNGNCVGLNNCCLSTGDSNKNPGNNFTVNLWYLPRGQAASVGFLINKSYRTIGNSWSSPFASILCLINTSYNIQPSVAISSTLYQTTLSGLNNIRLYLWNMITMTFDSSYLRTYVNSTLVSSLPASGNIDYGSNGPWDVGDKSVGGYNSYLYGFISDIRVETTVRDQTHITNMYNKALNIT